MTETNILEMETLALDDKEHALVIIDQTKLPNKAAYLHLKTQGEIWTAIHTLQGSHRHVPCRV